MRRLRRAYQRNARQEAKRRKKFKQRAPLETQMKHSLMGRRKKSLTGRAIAAGTAAAITLGAGVSLNIALAHTPDEHELPVSQDADADLLANKEELAVGYRVFEPDQNRNEIPDGVELAKRCAADINELPWQNDALPGETYRWGPYLLGWDICDICGAEVPMGPAGIVNPRLGINVECYLMAIHYMEHGSFSHSGDASGTSRIDVPALLRALELRFPYDPNEHQLPLDYVVESVGQLAPDANDLDGDLLADSEELAAGYNLHDPDQDNDLTPDGIEFAKQCAEVIEGLPEWDFQGDPPTDEIYKACYFQYGLEQCDICGQIVNMGFWQVINPSLGLSIDVYDITCHYMSHGSFSFAATWHNGRIDVPLLLKILEMPRRCGDLGTVYLPADLNEDCRVNFTDFIELADKWLESTDPNQDG
ncbi:hypothetical protein ES707_22626 [subsurface metagenome]